MAILPYRSLTDALLAAPSGKPFVTMWREEDDVQHVTFGEFREQARAQATFLAEHGVGPRDTVILIMPQGIPLMAAFAGAMMLGAVPAILAYPNFKVHPDKYRAGLAGVSANLKARLIVLDHAYPEDLLAHVGVGSDLVRAANALSQSRELPIHGPSDEDIAFIQHSAGTTGLQKGVALAHGAVLRQLQHLGTALAIGDTDRIYSWLPLYHDMGLIACFMLPMVYQLPVIMQSPDEWVIQPSTMLDLLTQYRCTLTWVPNFTLQFLARRVHRDDRADYDLSALRALINCSEPVRAESMDEFMSAFAASGLAPQALQSSYAMAENVFAVTQSNLDARPQRVWIDGNRLQREHRAVTTRAGASGTVQAVSSGRCLPGSSVRIVSGEGQDVADGMVGEIAIAGDCLFEGYYSRPDLTAQVMQDGWYFSGDLGFVLEEELYVTGRKKDLIIVGGKNIYPQDVEEIASSHPFVRDGRAIAMGVSNPDLGTEDLVIVVEAESGDGTEDVLPMERAIRTAITSELGIAVRSVYVKPPRWIVKSTAGKPARSATRERLLAEHPELVASRDREAAI